MASENSSSRDHAPSVGVALEIEALPKRLRYAVVGDGIHVKGLTNRADAALWAQTLRDVGRKTELIDRFPPKHMRGAGGRWETRA